MKEKKRKHEIGRAWKLTSSCCVVCVSPTSYKNKNNNTMNKYVKISSKKLGFPTHLFQETKLGSAISNIVLSSFHSKNIFSLILATRPNGHNWDPLNLFWDLLMCIKENFMFFLGLKNKWSMGFSIKIKQIVFHKLGNIHYTFKILFLPL